MKNNQMKSTYDSLQRKINYKKRKFSPNSAEKPNSTSPISCRKEIPSFQSNASYWNISKIFAAVILCIIASAPFTLIPQHDAIKYPKYWYETHIAVYFSFMLTSTIYDLMECRFLFEINSFLSLKSFLLNYGIFSTLLISFTTLSFAIFVLWMEYDPPLPWTAAIAYLIYVPSLSAIWFSIPYKERRKPELAKKFKIYIMYHMLGVYFFELLYMGFTTMFRLVPSDNQWILAFFLPVLRSIRSRLNRKVLCKAFDKNKATSMELIRTNVEHTFYISVALATTATNMSTYVILAVDFSLNILSAIKIVKIHRKIKPTSVSNSKMDDILNTELVELSLIEIIELLAPSVYISTLVVALYGPNSTILGNYGNGYWTFEAIEHVEKFLCVASKLVLIDFLSGIIGGLILWKYCSINFLREVCSQMQRFWVLITAMLMFTVNMVR